jgi:hypothetical protein
MSTPLTIARDDAAPPHASGPTLGYLASAAPLDEYARLGVEIAEDVERLKRKVETRSALGLHLLIAGQLREGA